LSLVLQVTLVSNHNNWEIILVLHPEYLLMECDDLLKRLSRCDGVDEEEAFPCAHVLFPHGRIFFLAGGVKDVEQGHFIINDTLLAV
jgi:hypothetical protein